MLVLDAFDEMADRGFADMLVEIFKHVIPEEAENAEEGENGEEAARTAEEPALANGEPALADGEPAVVEGLTPAVVLEAVALTESDTAARTARMQVVLFASSSGPLTHAARELARDITEKLSEPVRVIEIQNEPMRYSLGRVQQFYIAVSVN
jgi:superfamily II DNA/RNA helicase